MVLIHHLGWLEMSFNSILIPSQVLLSRFIAAITRRAKKKMCGRWRDTPPGFRYITEQWLLGFNHQRNFIFLKLMTFIMEPTTLPRNNDFYYGIHKISHHLSSGFSPRKEDWGLKPSVPLLFWYFLNVQRVSS